MVNNKNWFATLFRILITFFVFGFYIAMVFFAFKQNWEFLADFAYWLDTATSTGIALMFRWLYSDSGLDRELRDNEDIRALEEGKGKLVSQVNQQNLTGLLEDKIKRINKQNKVQAYRDKCDRKVNYLREKGWWKVNRKSRLKKWQERKMQIDTEDFNINAVRIKYYRYDLDEMLSSFYKQPNRDRTSRVSKDAYIVSSLRTNVITLLAIMAYNAITVMQKDYDTESLVVMLGKLIIFAVNIYTGFDLGKNYVRNIYSSNLTDDYAFLKEFLTENTNIKGASI